MIFPQQCPVGSANHFVGCMSCHLKVIIVCMYPRHIFDEHARECFFLSLFNNLYGITRGSLCHRIPLPVGNRAILLDQYDCVGQLPVCFTATAAATHAAAAATGCAAATTNASASATASGFPALRVRGALAAIPRRTGCRIRLIYIDISFSRASSRQQTEAEKSSGQETTHFVVHMSTSFLD